MNSVLRERFARLGRVQDIDRVSSGSPGAYALSLGSGGLRGAKTISAILALYKRGLALPVAKRAVEQVVEEGMCAVALPTVEDAAVLKHELALAGFAAIECRGQPTAGGTVTESAAPYPVPPSTPG